jgi:hypothetical protein
LIFSPVESSPSFFWSYRLWKVPYLRFDHLACGKFPIFVMINSLMESFPS